MDLLVATNNAVNLKSSGIVSYDGAGTFSALANPLTVTNGGTGVSSNTAYAVLCGGTTSTAAIQSIASVGTIGQVLTSNGAGALPTFQDAPGSAWSFARSCLTGNPADATTYFIANGVSLTSFTSSVGSSRYIFAKSGTIAKCYGVLTVQGTLGTAGSSTISIRLNNSSDTTVTSSLAATASANTFNNTGLSIAVVAGDYIEIKMLTPTWATNPTTVALSLAIEVS